MKYGFMILTLWISACASLTVYSESQAIDLVMKSIERNQLTALKTECLMFVVENKTTFYEIDVREKHNQHCGGDPTTAPRLFTYQVNKQTGSLKIDESVSDGWYRLLQNKDIIMDENKIIPHFSQRQLLTNLLEIMEISHSKDDFTPENISKIFGVTLNVSKNGEFFFGGTITPHWKYYFDKSRKGFLSENLFVIELKFYMPEIYMRTNNSYINEVCDMDIDEFVQKAQTLGYIQYPLNRRNFAIPGIVLKRDNLALHIEEVVALSPNEKRCIARIIIDREF